MNKDLKEEKCVFMPNKQQQQKKKHEHFLFFDCFKCTRDDYRLQICKFRSKLLYSFIYLLIPLLCLSHRRRKKGTARQRKKRNTEEI